MPTRTKPGRNGRPRTRTDGTTGVGETVLANGLKLLTLERHDVPIVTVMIWYRVGSAREEEGRTGLAHFLEHLMFKGTDRYKKGEIDRLTQRLGATNNAMTSRDCTCYYFNLPAGDWLPALEIEANRMRRCRFPPGEVELERSVVLEEIGRNEDSPYGALDTAVFAAAYSTHPYRHPILGWRDDLAGVRRGAIREFYDRHYHPSNAFVVMAGDFATPQAVQAVERLFARIPPGPRPDRPVRTESRAKGEKRVAVRMDVQVPKVQILFRTVPGNHADDRVLDVVASLLSDGRSSLLFRRLVEERRLMTDVDTVNDTKVEDGVFWIYGTIHPEVHPDRGVDEVVRCLERIATQGPSVRALAQAKNQSEADFLYNWEKVFNQAYLVGKSELLGDLDRLGRYTKDVQSVTAADVRRVVSEYLGPDRMTVGLLLPERRCASGAPARSPSMNPVRARRSAGGPDARREPEVVALLRQGRS
ncbi:MAG: insulinase family protein, partial [Planctomycetes bacterium]|nr:insulinase family protein [Planctomycetota bacterium]